VVKPTAAAVGAAVVGAAAEVGLAAAGAVVAGALVGAGVDPLWQADTTTARALRSAASWRETDICNPSWAQAGRSISGGLQAQGAACSGGLQAQG
jgi:hypothetical protein